MNTDVLNIKLKDCYRTDVLLFSTGRKESSDRSLAQTILILSSPAVTTVAVMTLL
jgi:hypothetical protein